MRDKKYAFTLAEVLITLVIIGVVAALTIPNLMHKHMQKELEVRFKRAVTTINQAISLWAYEEGSGLRKRHATYDQQAKVYSDPDISNLWKYLKIQDYNFSYKHIYYTNYNNTAKEANVWYNNLDKKAESIGLHKRNGYMTPDGMYINAHVSSSNIYIFVDLNGAKGPNRLGYDYFTFFVSEKDAITGKCYLYCSMICNNTDTTSNNGEFCAEYALRNKCPYDDTKTYWECLK